MWLHVILSVHLIISDDVSFNLKHAVELSILVHYWLAGFGIFGKKSSLFQRISIRPGQHYEIAGISFRVSVSLNPFKPFPIFPSVPVISILPRALQLGHPLPPSPLQQPHSQQDLPSIPFLSPISPSFRFSQTNPYCANVSLSLVNYYNLIPFSGLTEWSNFKRNLGAAVSWKGRGL